MRKMKVLYSTAFNPQKTLGGVETVLKMITSRLPQNISYDVVWGLESNKTFLRHSKEFINFSLFLNSLAKKNYDVVHAQAWSSLASGMLSKLNKVPIISTVHGTAYGMLKYGKISSVLHALLFKDVLLHEKYGFKMSDIVACCSKHVEAEVVEGYGVPEENATVVYNGIDTNLFKPIKVERTDKKILLTTGRINVSQKGLDLLEKVFVHFDERDVIKIINGTVEYPLRNVRVQRVPTLEDMPKVYSSADVFIQTSRYEGFSMALLEAMACGLPPVVFDTAGGPEAVRDGKDGFVVPFGDVDMMVERINKLLEDHRLWRKMSESARKRVADNFTVDLMVSRYVSLYERLVG